MKQLMIKLKGVAMAALTMAASTALLPAQAEEISYVAPVYKEVGGVTSPTNGIAYWVTNNVPSGYTIVASVEDSVGWGAVDQDSWYVVTNGSFQIDGSVACTGHVHLVLCEGAQLTVLCGIDVSADTAELTIYGQPDGAGMLEATGYGGAAIGGVWGASGPITINGGTVTATGGYNASGIGGGSEGAGTGITINGGTVTAMGGYDGSGIGGGHTGAGTGITINGGTVTATGISCGSGIGGGGWGAGTDITINGGEVTATGGNDIDNEYGGTGIGGGGFAAGSGITINGGTVTATGGYEGSGIGGGNGTAGTAITITGGEVTATGGDCGSGIGGGGHAAGTGITINGGTVAATGGNDPDWIDGAGAGIGGGGGGAGTDITISGGEVTALGGDACDDNVNCGAAGIGGGEWGIGTNITINGGTVFVANQAPLADLIGCGSDAGEVASGVTIAAAANVMFDLTISGQVPTILPTWNGCAILTPETPVTRVLVSGINESGASGIYALPWALTNAATSATNTITLGGVQRFANTNLKLKHANSQLTLNTFDAMQVGDDVWADIENGDCTIFGAGTTYAYDAGSSSALYACRSSITNLVVQDGVTGIGAHFFDGFRTLRNVTLGADCASIGSQAFLECWRLTNVVSTAATMNVGAHAFYSCNSLEAMAFGVNPTFGEKAFSLQSAIYLKNGVPQVYAIPQITISGYTEVLKGSNDLQNWVTVTDDTKSNYHFFKIVMEKKN